MGRAETPSGLKTFFSSRPRVGRSANLPGQAQALGFNAEPFWGSKTISGSEPMFLE